MSSLPSDTLQTREDDPMNPPAEEEEGAGDDLMNGQGGAGDDDDSSEEEEEDAEEEARIRDGFIVDEEEEEGEEEDEDEDERRRRKRRKRKHRRHRHRDEEDEELDDEDRELLEENTGVSSRKRLTRLHRGHGSASPPLRRKAAAAESSDDDLELPEVQDIQRIWDDERGGGRDDEDDDDMHSFIEDEDEEEGGGAADERELEERRKERRRERRKAILGSKELAGIDASAWDEIHEVFGDGHEYDWALEADDEPEFDEAALKPEMKYQDVFEPSEIRDRLLTEDDDLIRAQDIPERMQLASSSLSQSSTLSLSRRLTENDLPDAAGWVATRLGPEKERDFFRPDGRLHHYLADLIQALTHALRFIFVELLEVPHIWTHKRDYLCHFNARDIGSRLQLLALDDLWKVQTQGQKYCSLMERRAALDSLYSRLGVDDDYFEKTIRRKVDNVEMIADATEWLSLRYKDKKKDSFRLAFHDDEETEAPKHKLPSRMSAYEVAKKSVVAKLAEGFGIKPTDVVHNFLSPEANNFVEDQELEPLAYAEQFADPDPSKAQPGEALLVTARLIVSTELGRDPILRQEMRQKFKSAAQISVLPTDRGLNKIDEHHPYFKFKYLYQKPVMDMLHSALFLNILAAESEHLVTVTVTLPDAARADFQRRLDAAFASEGYGDSARAWNEARSRVVHETIDNFLIPAGVKFVRGWLREEIEDYLAWRCSETLRERIDVMPYHTSSMQPGETPSVLAISWGKGVLHRDKIMVVYLDEAGRLREHADISELDDKGRDELKDIVARRRPDVCVIGGFSMTALKLTQRVKETLHEGDSQPNPENPWDAAAPSSSNNNNNNVPILYIFDEVARIYQHSKRAEEEFGSLSSLAKYCVGLARYAQSPLNEYAALGPDITAISFDEDNQHLVPRDKLLSALERTLVDVTNNVGVDINRAVIDSYYQRLLPFICGLGPRKAQVLVKRIAAMGGTVISRVQMVESGILSFRVVQNAIGFLRIASENDMKPSKSRQGEQGEVSDPLDDTRIHPEDYELARKMAIDALELDEEDVEGEHPSHVVSLLIQDKDSARKLEELNLDDFALSMYEANEDRKRVTLDLVKAELLRPFGDRRPQFVLPDAWDVITMLSGETRRTLRVGFIVSVLVTRIRQSTVNVRLDSGIEGVINSQYLSNDGDLPPDEVVKKGQTLPGVVLDIPNKEIPNESFVVELSARPVDVHSGDHHYRKVRPDEAWNHQQFERDTEMQARKKRAEVGRTRRIIKHPNFHNFNALQAETYLENQERGDVVLRPSSKGADHLAVTWKVDDKLVQHVDVVEHTNPADQSSRFIIAGGPTGKYEFSDLDELIVNHIQAMTRRVEELIMHEKFKTGSEDDLHLFLRNFVAANPAKSAYGFTLNRKRPGHFSLCFLSSKSSSVQTWPVRVAPEAYYLFETAVPGVAELCDAFKMRHLHESQSVGAGGGGKTPAYGRTPARTPGHATPGHASVRHVRTPNPYNAPAPAPAAPTPGWGGAPAPGSSWGNIPPPQPLGYQTPSQFAGQPGGYPPQPGIPPGMNPQRAAAIVQAGGWGQTPSRSGPW